MSHISSLIMQPCAATRQVSIGWLAALGTVIIWAAWAVGTRHAVTSNLQPAAVGLLRFSVPALLLVPVLWRTGLFPKGLTFTCGLGLLGSGAPFFLVVATGMQFAPAAEIGSLLPGTMPLFVALIGWVVFGERLGGLRIAGLTLILLGVVCVAGYGLFFTKSGAWPGHVLLLTGACLWSFYTHAYRRSGLSALQATALVGAWSVFILIPIGGPPLVHALTDGLSSEVILQILLQGLVAGVGGIVLYGIAIDRLGATRAAVVSPLSPALAALIAIPVLREIPNMAAIAGIVATTLGVMMASGILSKATRASLEG